jgi:imidazolonepropionase-like amidohydrolase
MNRRGWPDGIRKMKIPRVTIRLAAICASALLFLTGAASQAQTPAGETIALTGGRVIDGTGRAPIDQATLIIANGRIAAVGPSASVNIPTDAVRIDMSGKTIIPGLINAHGHLNVDDYTQLPPREHLLQCLQVYADYGVTTVVSLGSTDADELEDLKIRNEQRLGTPDRARLFTAGAFAIGKTPDEARKAVDRLADEKVDIIKYKINGLPDDMTPEVYGALVDEAKKRGLRTAVHIFYLKDAKEAIAKGTDILAHSVRDQDVDQALIAEMKRKNIAYIPTLTRDLSVFVYETEPKFFQDPFFLRGMYAYRTEVNILKNPAHQEALRKNPQVQAEKSALQHAMRNLKTLFDAGIPIAMGTDSGSANDLGRWQGYFEHVELAMMVKAGLTPMQALVAATGGAARIMKLDRLGTLEPGNWADLLVLNANPLTDIRNTRQIASVWIAGRRLPDRK